MAEEQRRNPGDMFDLWFMTAFRIAMDKLTIPDTDTPVCIMLYHTNLVPRNIFVDTKSGAITDVWDWDLAESAPVEAAWQLPAWLWDKLASGSFQLKWVSPDDIPLDPWAMEIRQFFLTKAKDAIPGFIEPIRHSKPIFELLVFTRHGFHSEEIIH